MSTNRRMGAGAGATTATRANASAKRRASSESKAWQGALLQTARKGRAADIIALLADLEASGDITNHPDEMEDNADVLEDENALDAEISLADEDDPLLPGWDDENAMSHEPTFSPGQTLQDTPAQATLPIKIELLVSGGTCRVHRPSWWMRARAITNTGKKQLDEIGKRWVVLDAIADWLSKKRTGFLESADPWFLGTEALEEMRQGHVSVSPGSFLTLAGLRQKVSPDLFSRYVSDCFLVWENGTLRLAFVFGEEARTAWVANAVAQFAAAQGNTLTESDLDRFATITVPRAASDRNDFWRKNVEHLEFAEFIAKANLMADTKWFDVISAYRMRIGSSRH